MRGRADRSRSQDAGPRGSSGARLGRDVTNAPQDAEPGAQAGAKRGQDGECGSQAGPSGGRDDEDRRRDGRQRGQDDAFTGQDARHRPKPEEERCETHDHRLPGRQVRERKLKDNGSQEANRYRFWARVPDLGNRYLRAVTLDDQTTIPNALSDRGFKP